MGAAFETITASKANITGGAYEALAAVSGDSLTVRAFDSGNASLLDMWAVASDNPALFDVRSPRLHDNVRGILVAASLQPGGATHVGAQIALPDGVQQPYYSADPLVVEVNGTAADDCVLCQSIYYSDLPGANANLHTWQEIKARLRNVVGILVQPVANATAGSRGAAVALNSVDARLKADTQYALLGAYTTIPVALIGFFGADTGNYRVGIPGTYNADITGSWFQRLSNRENLPLIPVINANNQGSTNIDLVDSEASTAPNITLMFAELAGRF